MPLIKSAYARHLAWSPNLPELNHCVGPMWSDTTRCVLHGGSLAKL